MKIALKRSCIYSLFQKPVDCEKMPMSGLMPRTEKTTEVGTMLREAEDLAKSLWNVINTVVKSMEQPHLKAKREQIKVINESIRQLADKNVPVPEDLDTLKNSLSDEVEKADKDQLVLFFLREQLSQMLTKIEAQVGLHQANREGKTLEDL
jgi:hypothetical protein